MKTVLAETESLSFNQLPHSYEELCRLYLPRPIHDRYDYHAAVRITDVFAGFEENMNKDQRDYFDLLVTLIADYEEVKPPKRSPQERLQHLLSESGTSASGLARILGLERSVGVRIVNGERNLTLEHVRNLSKYFKVAPSFFV